MFGVIQSWYQKRFSNPEATMLFIALILCVLVLVFFGGILAPVIAALILAYLLEDLVASLQHFAKFPRFLAVTIIYLAFITLVVFAVFWLIPLLVQQASQLVTDAPKMLNKLHQLIASLPQKYSFISPKMSQDLVNYTSFSSDKVTTLGKAALSLSVSSVPSIISWLVYLFLVPFLVLFFLKDKSKLVQWCQSCLPEERGMITRVWTEMQGQIGNYVRGKALEVIVVGVASYIGFWAFGMNYAPLLGVLVGLSVIIPYVGMVIVTIPVIIIGLLQWGTAPEFVYMLIVYFVIQALDGNVLVPLLFSEAVNLHPIAIIVAVLFFGGIWGFWGLFFAIPLATLVKAVISAWLAV